MFVFPSPEFDDAVAAVSFGTASHEQAEALNHLLRSDSCARDEYLFRLELHARLGSDPDLFTAVDDCGGSQAALEVVPPLRPVLWLAISGILAVAAGFAILAVARWRPDEETQTTPRAEMTSKAVAMLNQLVDAEWMDAGEGPSVGMPLEAGWLRLKSGLAQVVFYNGARVVIQGPTEFELISQSEASCPGGQLIAEVPPQAQGFRVDTPQAGVTDLGTSFGLTVNDQRTEVHVFAGKVELRPASDGIPKELREGSGAMIDGSHPPQEIVASQTLFAPLFYLESKSVASAAERFKRWKKASNELNQDPSLLLHLDFEGGAASGWRLRSAGYPNPKVPDASIVGCQWTTGRWPQKRALEYQGVSDRVRLSVPGEFESLTLAVWVRVQGLDRQINSLFMSDGFEPGTVHWSVRNDGVLGLTVIGERSGDYQIAASLPVLTLDQFGRWLHLAVVLDGRAKQVVHYVDGEAVSEKALRLNPPFRVGSAELGNWNPSGFPGNDPFLVRNFSGAMDEFTLFARALKDDEIRSLHAAGKPPSEMTVPSSIDPKTE
jgi:hypothetical protein